MDNQQNTTLLSILFNESLDAILILDLKTQKFIIFNKKALELYNYTEEEFKNITPQDLTLEFISKERIQKKQKNILEKGWDKFVTKHKTKDGKAINVLIKSKKIELVPNSPLLYITVHNLEKEKELEVEFQTIFHSSRDGIAIIDLNGNFVKFNDSFKNLSEYTYEELLNFSSFQLFSEISKEKIKIAIDEVIKNGYIENFETTFITKYGKSMAIYITMNLMPNQEQILLIVRNFTNLKLLELEKRFESLNELVQNIAHQWKQPLSTISIIASNIKLQKELDLYDYSGLNEDMNKIVNISNELSKTINNFDTMIFENFEKSYGIYELITEILKEMETIFIQNNITVLTKFTLDYKIYVDKIKFSQAIINILNNSIETFLENETQNRVISISTDSVDNHLRLKIEDNAGGIDENILPKIFEPYFTTKHQTQGKGLGLTNTYKTIVKIYKFLLTVNNCEILIDDKKYQGLSVTITF
ncbi:MAG: PAS domain-containing sensor histidine kinase [Aliarcobacter sp.]|nr:PAS domain-containing sensor histidine kinase [Aliarcobacter sp.]